MGSMTHAPLRSRQHEVADPGEADELFQRNGWTDGFPVVPPTEVRVRACLAAAELEPAALLGVESVRGLPLTAEKVAVNAVMAGWLPAYFPVAVESPRQVMNEWTDDPAELCETFAAEMRGNMLTYSIWAGPYVLVIPKQLRDLFVAAGWQKRDVREYVHRAARVRREDWRRVG